MKPLTPACILNPNLEVKLVEIEPIVYVVPLGLSSLHLVPVLLPFLQYC